MLIEEGAKHQAQDWRPGPECGKDGTPPFVITADPMVVMVQANARWAVETRIVATDATPADAAATVEEVLESVRPLSVVEQRISAQLADVDAQLETALVRRRS